MTGNLREMHFLYRNKNLLQPLLSVLFLTGMGMI